jgi:hypothetical protein
MVPPLLAKAPVMFDEVSTVQVKFVPATPFGFVMATLVLDPEQIVCGDAAASGIGVTDTFTA